MKVKAKRHFAVYSNRAKLEGVIFEDFNDAKWTETGRLRTVTPTFGDDMRQTCQHPPGKKIPLRPVLMFETVEQFNQACELLGLHRLIIEGKL